MSFALFILLTYTASLIWIRPSPKNLKADPIPMLEHLLSIKATLTLGVLLIIIFYMTTQGSMKEVNPEVYYTYALKNNFNFSLKDFLSIVTNIFLHINLYHLTGNLFMLALLSSYERRVGTLRYLAVLIIAALFSDLSILFYSDDIAISGISGGLFGLAAAFFVDHKSLSKKEWIYALIAFVCLALIFGILDMVNIKREDIPLSIDYVGHILGALAAVAYTRWQSLP